MKKKLKIKFTKERVVLSDILPYETPLTFSNRHFYNFLVTNKIEIKGNTIFWEKGDDILDTIIGIFFGIKIDSTGNSSGSYEIKNDKINTFFVTIPFNFKIANKISDFRELSIVHPRNQILLVDFYNNFKELIIYYSNISPFSIRKPDKIAKHIFYNDYLHKIQNNENLKYDSIEETNKEYENLKTFFTYKEYSNIYKFFESYHYQRCEKKYNELFKFDISKCFDSIYTHSLSWALLGKDIVKDEISLSNKTFPGLFDKFMRDINYCETNGILIGPEFSRIFCELLLQQIDKKVYLLLESMGFHHKIDYEIFRYVDDYFIFYNNDNVKNKISDYYNKFLREYKLYFSESKTDHYSRPIITELTIAKFKINKLIKKYFLYLDNKIFKNNSNEEESKNQNKRYSDIETYKNSKNLITEFKIIVKETNVKYREILNYTLALIERRINALLNKYNKKENSEKLEENNFVNLIIGILDFTFFIYLVSPEVSTTIKLSSLLSILINYLKNRSNFCKENKRFIFKKIYDEVFIVFQKYRIKEFTQVETSYLLIVLSELGKDYRLDSQTIEKYFHLDDVKDGKIKLNYFSITVLLFYIKNIKRYKDIKKILINHIIIKLKNLSKGALYKNTETILLLLDLIVCPYLEMRFRKKILKIFNINKKQKKIIDKQKYWFTKWSDFNYIKEIQAKISQEVYN